MIDIQSLENAEPISHFGLTWRLFCVINWKMLKHEYGYDLDNNLFHINMIFIEYNCSKQCSYNGREEYLYNYLDNESTFNFPFNYFFRD